MNNEKVAKELLLIAKGLQSSLIQPPPQLVKDIVLWIRQSYAYTRRWKLEDLIEQGEEMDFQSLKDVKKELKRVERLLTKHSDYKPVYIPYGEKRAMIFNVDLTGWKYSPRLNKLNKTQRKKALFGFKKVRVTVDGSIMAENQYSGWGSKYKNITIVGSSWDWDYTESVVHELRHWTQDLLKQIANNWEAGYPSKKIRTREIKQYLGRFKNQSVDRIIEELSEQGIGDSDYHALDDVEFYTDVGESIDKLASFFKKNKLSRVEKLEAIKVFVGAKPKRDVEDKKLYGQLWASNTFDILKKSKPKWKKAVKLLVSELL